MGIWTFIQDQLLGMKWLNGLIGAGLEALGLDVDGACGGFNLMFAVATGLLAGGAR